MKIFKKLKSEKQEQHQEPVSSNRDPLHINIYYIHSRLLDLHNSEYQIRRSIDIDAIMLFGNSEKNQIN